MDSDLIHNTLEKLYHSLIEFLHFLSEEKESIRQQNIMNLSKASSQKEAIASKINENYKDLVNLTNQSNIKEMLVASELSDHAYYLTECHQLIEQCHDLNLANGLSMQILINMNQEMLNLLKGTGPQPELYSSSGDKQKSSLEPTKLGQA
jgi:flagella synthesis protein FlgN